MFLYQLPIFIINFRLFFIRLQEIEAEFDKHVSLKDIASQQLDVDPDGIVYIYNYWKLKRRVSKIWKHHILVETNNNFLLFTMCLCTNDCY